METEIIVGGIELGAFIILAVQVVKVMGLENELWLKLSPVIAGVFFAALFAVEALVPGAAQYVDMAIKAIVGIGSAVLGYKYAIKPGLENLGVPVSRASLEE